MRTALSSLIQRMREAAVEYSQAVLFDNELVYTIEAYAGPHALPAVNLAAPYSTSVSFWQLDPENSAAGWLCQKWVHRPAPAANTIVATEIEPQAVDLAGPAREGMKLLPGAVARPFYEELERIAGCIVEQTDWVYKAP